MKKLACKNNSGLAKFLTEGQCYECVGETSSVGQFPAYYAVIDNLGEWHMFEASRFEVIPDYKEPPLGIMPRWRWLELRINDLQNAFIRYIDAGIAIPMEWLEEYNSLIKLRQEE